MFCSKCGEKIEEGAKFCAKCGTAVNTTTVPNTPPPTEAFGSVTNDVRTGNHERADVGSKSMEQIAENYKPQNKIKPLETTQEQVDQTSRQDQPKTSESPKKKSKLLIGAVIITPAIWVIFWLGLNIFYNVQQRVRLDRLEKEIGIEYREGYENFLKEEREKEKTDWNMFFSFIIGSFILAIPTLLTVIGERKNRRKMILAAGIVYIYTGVGIPSAVLCFIAFAKMKKK